MKALILVAVLLFILTGCSDNDPSPSYRDFELTYDGTTAILTEYGKPSVTLTTEDTFISFSQCGCAAKEYTLSCENEIVDVLGVDEKGYYTRKNFKLIRISYNKVILEWQNNTPVVIYFNVRTYN